VFRGLSVRRPTTNLTRARAAAALAAMNAGSAAGVATTDAAQPHHAPLHRSSCLICHVILYNPFTTVVLVTIPIVHVSPAAQLDLRAIVSRGYIATRCLWSHVLPY